MLRQLTCTLARPDAAEEVRQVPRSELTALLHDVFGLVGGDEFPAPMSASS